MSEENDTTYIEALIRNLRALQYSPPTSTFYDALNSALPALLEAASDIRQSDLVRVVAIRLLGASKNPSVIPTLLELLRTQNYRVYTNAFDELKEFGSEAVKPLIQVLAQEDNPDLFRSRVASLLGELEAGEAFEILAGIVRQITDPVVRPPRVPYFKSLGSSIETFMTETGFNPFLSIPQEASPEPLEPLTLERRQEMHRVMDWVKNILLDEESLEEARALAVTALSPYLAGENLRAMVQVLSLGRIEPTAPQLRIAAVAALGNLGDKRAVPLLIPTLFDPDAGIRLASVRGLAELVSSEAVEPLITLLEDSEEEVQEAAIRALGSLKDPRAIKPLAKIFRGKNDGLIQEAAEALAEIGGEALSVLIQGFKARRVCVRKATVSALKYSTDPEAFENLILATKDKNPEVRQEAVEGLGWRDFDERINNPEIKPDPLTLESVVVCLKDKNAEVRKAAVEAIGNLGDNLATHQLIPVLKDRNPAVREEAVRILSFCTDEIIVEPLMEVYQKTQDSSQKAYILQALGRTRSTKVYNLALKALKNEDLEIKEAAAVALGEIKDPRSFVPLMSAFQDTANPLVSGQAAIALGKLRDERAFMPLIETLQSGDALLTIKVAEALGEFGDARAVEPLMELLRDPYYEYRYYAAQALGKIGDPRPLELLNWITENDPREIATIIGAEVSEASSKAVEQINARLGRKQNP